MLSGTPDLLLVLAFGELLDDLGAEGGHVVGAATGHQTLVGHNFLVHPLSACIAGISLQGREGGQRTVPDQYCDLAALQLIGHVCLLSKIACA